MNYRQLAVSSWQLAVWNPIGIDQLLISGGINLEDNKAIFIVKNIPIGIFLED